MSERKDRDALATAEATRRDIMKTIRRQAEDVVEQLQRDVFRLIDDAQRDADPPFEPERRLFPEPASPGRHRDHECEHERGHHHHLDEELRHLIKEIVRAEIAAQDIPALVKAEVDQQLRNVTRLLQERLKGAPRQTLQRAVPGLSRRRL